MGQMAGEFARSVVTKWGQLPGFEATQEIAGGGLRIEARVRSAGGRLVAEYRSAENPFSELTDRLVGDVEYSSEELVGMTFLYDGRVSWAHDSATETVIERRGRRVGEPVGDVDLVGEVSFLRDLTADYLLRDRGESEIGGRTVRRFSIKPKRPFRVSAVRVCSYPIRVAHLSFDCETHFPMAMEIEPSSASPLYAVLGDREPLRITYRDVKTIDRLEIGEPDGKRTFHETSPDSDVLIQAVPFALSLDFLQEAGFQPVPSSVALFTESEGERAFLEVSFVDSEPRETRRRMVLRCGNYLSRNMARRRVLLAEQGEPVETSGESVRYVDRTAGFAEEIPGLADRPLGEVGWEKDGVYWFVLGEGVTKDELVRIVAGSPADA